MDSALYYFQQQHEVLMKNKSNSIDLKQELEQMMSELETHHMIPLLQSSSLDPDSKKIIALYLKMSRSRQSIE